jgi:hypothetical protein
MCSFEEVVSLTQLILKDNDNFEQALRLFLKGSLMKACRQNSKNERRLLPSAGSDEGPGLGDPRGLFPERNTAQWRFRYQLQSFFYRYVSNTLC